METREEVVLITGAAKRCGLALSLAFHRVGLKVFIHTRKAPEGEALAHRLNTARNNSAGCFACDLREETMCEQLVAACMHTFGRVDVLINNASVFRRQSIGSITSASSLDQLSSNLVAPLLLIQAATPYLRQTKGCVVNMTDIQVETRPIKGYSLYVASKAGLDALTRSLALELSPDVRVNGVALSLTEWPEDWSQDDPRKAEVLARVPLGRGASYEEVAAAVQFLTLGNHYVTGHILKLDGGASIS